LNFQIFNIFQLVNIRGGAQDSFIKGGTQQIAKFMAKEIGHANILIDSPVVSIKYSTNKVSVLYMKKRQLSMVRAKHCIIAMSPNLLGRIQYYPPLPSLKDQLCQRMPGGSVIKIHIFYKKNFWKNLKFSGELISFNGPIALSYDKSYDGFNCLVAFVAGSGARAWSKKTNEDRKQEALEQLERVYETKEALKPLNYVETDWTTEEWSRGCYFSVPQPGALSECGEYLRKSIGPLHFAGSETSINYLGYLEGALESGIRAANEVYQSKLQSKL
jgi:monoamine oxidase